MAQAQPRKDAPKATQPPRALPPGTKSPAAVSDVCDPATRNLDGISAALNQGLSRGQKACATTASPARIKLLGAVDRAIVVRPLTGDVDAFLTRNSEIVDVSLNTKRRAELVLLPPAGELELVVAAESATATFEVSAVQLGRSVDNKTRSDKTVPVSQKGSPQSPDEQAATKGDTTQPGTMPPWAPGVFRDLGYDLINPASPVDDPANLVDPRAIMAFQAGEKFEITGTMKPEQVTVLANQAALQIDAAAQGAASTTRRISQSSPVVPFPDPVANQAVANSPNPTTDQTGKKGPPAKDDQSADPPEPSIGLKSMKGVFSNGKFFGIGLLRSGSRFEGEWLDGPTAGDSQRPALGMLFLPNDCAAAIKTFGMAAASDETVLDEFAIISSSVGVVRQKGKKIFAGDLAQAGDQLQSCMPDSSR